jgi:hypothetical protein
VKTPCIPYQHSFPSLTFQTFNTSSGVQPETNDPPTRDLEDQPPILNSLSIDQPSNLNNINVDANNQLEELGQMLEQLDKTNAESNKQQVMVFFCKVSQFKNVFVFH